MTPQELRSSILQLAVQGKLVKQCPEEGTGEELFERIQAEKQKLIKAGKIKREKPLPEITEDEIPFEIPESWKWVRIGSLLHKLVDGTHRTPKYTTTGVPFVSVRNMSNGHLSLEDTKFITEEEHRELWSRCNPQRGDILLSKVGTTGVPAKVDTDAEFSLFVSVALLKFNNELLNADFLIYSILAPDFQRQCEEHTRGVGNKNWVIVDIANTMMPLPPLAEQKRIVAKIEELLPYIDRYEKAWSRLEDFNKRFPVDMQKSILQMAIQGKLVEQRPEEGTGEELYQQIQAEKQKLIKEGKIKKEKPLPEISEDEIPFDIPESWKWVRFGYLYSLSNGTASRGSKDGEEHPVLRLADLSNNIIDTNNVRKIRLTDKEFMSHRVQEDDLIFIRVNGSKDRVATAFHYTGKGIISYCDHLFCGHKCSSLVYADFIMFIFNCPYTRKQLIPEIKTTAGQNTISQSSMAKILLPLPPLAEQKRIVAKLEEILPLCERLK